MNTAPKSTLSLLALSISLSLSSPASFAEQASTTQVSAAKANNTKEATLPFCTPEQQSRQDTQHCQIEQIEVKGRFLGFEVPESTGRVYLNREYIERAPKTTGDINELLTRLAGVQASDELMSAKQMGEIRARELSISGAQPWQSGFFIDGINFNSRIDPGYTQTSENNDNSGVAQAFTVNSRLIDQVVLYDSNIPAEFGAFSGGVVDIRTRSPKDFSGSTFGLEYRTTKDSISSYHLIEENQDRYTELADEIPNYDITDIGAYAVYKINNNHSVLVDVSYTQSKIDELSLNQFVNTYRENINVLLKYTMTDVLFDRQDFTFTYAPYESDSILKHVMGSRQTVDQGGYAAQWKLEHDFKSVSWQSALSFSTSDNSKTAAAHFKPWQQAKGRLWGLYDPANDSVIDKVELISNEGNYGSLEKTQEDISWRQKFLFNATEHNGVRQQWQIGSDVEQQRLTRSRAQVHYLYGSGNLYSSNNNPLNCNGFYSDCIELALSKPLNELANDLGGRIDFSNPDHLAAYEANVITSAQFFNFRRTYAPEHLDITVNQGALFASNQIEWGAFQATVGVRYNYDDFFKNHNIAPRLSAGYTLDENGKQLISLGLNRYYDANLLSYRIRELETPYYTEYRATVQGVVQNWVRSSDDSDYRYRYSDVRTPYNDELSLSYKIATDDLGTFAIKAVKRWKKDQLASSGDPVKDSDGYLYRSQDNSASGTYERVSLSWHLSHGIHSFWANLSWQDNWTSAQHYDDDVDTTSLDELVYMSTGNGYEVATLSTLKRQNLNFNRPIKLDFGITSDWLDWFDSSVNFSYVDGYETFEETSLTRRYLVTQDCIGCEVGSINLPIYAQVNKRARFMTDLSFRFKVWESAIGKVQLTADINNLFNQRTYIIPKGENGVERGRQIWLGIKYDFK